MRVADTMRYTQATQQLASIRGQHHNASSRALTGRRLTAPSDDPIAASEVTRLASRYNQVQGQKTAITRVQGDAELAEGVLAEAGNVMTRAVELVMQAASDQTSPETRQNIAEDLQGLRDQLLALANSKGSNGYIFAGNQTTTQPFDAAGTFLGDDGAHNVDIGSGSPTRVNASGAQAFTAAGGNDIFADLDATIAALNADDGDAIRAGLDNLRAGHEQVVDERGRAGLLIERLETSTEVLDRAEFLVVQQDEAVGAADQVEAYSDFVTLGQALERAIGISSQLLNMSSLNQF